MKIQMTLRFHLHPSQSDYHQENKWPWMLVRMLGKMSPYTLLF
jgi:hypothetical protein